MKGLFGLAFALALFLAGCGGGGGSSNPPPPPAPPSALSYPTPHIFTIGIAITAVTPTVTGSPTSYSISPALPAGLTFNTTTGVVTGTPAATQAATNHTVTASNAGGSTTAVLAVTVNDPPPPSITYPRASYSLTTEILITTIAPTATGGAIVSWSISPALPAGLVFNTTTGELTGTPTAINANATYRVTATNSGGSDTFDLSIGVFSTLLFDFGASVGNTLRYQGTRILGIAEPTVTLWNAQTGAEVLSVDAGCDSSCGGVADLKGPTVVTRDLDGFDVFDANTGALVSHIAVPQKSGTLWVLSSDGSYIVNYHDLGLEVWSRNGSLLVSRTGDYLDSPVFAAPGELRIARGPAGDQVIENIALPSGTSTLSAAFSGGFRAWFGDGERFLSAVGSTLVVYSRLAVQQDIAALLATGEMGGYGNLFWIRAPNELRVYTVGASATPVATYSLSNASYHISASTLALVSPTQPAISVIDLSGALPVRTDYSTPAADVWRFAAVSATDWAYSTTRELLYRVRNGENPPQLVRFSYGSRRGIAASPQRVSIATTSGNILNFDLATRTLESVIEFDARVLRMSADGSVLAAMMLSDVQPGADQTLKVFSLPSRNLIREWPAVRGPFIGGEARYDFDMSAAGDVFALSSFINDGTWHTVIQRVMRIDDSTIWSNTMPNMPFMASDPLNVSLRLSPSGMRFAASTAGFTLGTATNLYENGTLIGAAFGWGVGWIDESRLLINRFEDYRGNPYYNRAEVVSTTGQLLATPAIPTERSVRELQRLGGNLIYSPHRNAILDATTGAVVWTPRYAGATPVFGGAVGGDLVIYSAGRTIRAEPR
jgi:hypothetical protein